MVRQAAKKIEALFFDFYYCQKLLADEVLSEVFLAEGTLSCSVKEVTVAR
jgi:hypothetical protein